jgi:hypothetical protein
MLSQLKDKRITIKMEKQPLGKVFRHLIVNYDVPIGFEESILDRDHNDYEFETNLPYPGEKTYESLNGSTRITIQKERGFIVEKHWFTVNAEDEKLEDVLNSIVGQMNNYKWEINDGVVNIFPIKGRDERYKRLLDVNIKNYNLEIENHNSKTGMAIFEIRNRIFELPEVIEFLNENKFYYSDYRESIDNHDRKLFVEVNFSNLTFKELLNKITKIKRGGWILKTNDLFGTKEKEYIEMRIKSRNKEASRQMRVFRSNEPAILSLI